MNVINPELNWIGKRCYRVNIPSQTSVETTRQFNYEDQDEEFEECYHQEIEKDVDIKEIEGGKRFQLKMHVPQMFHSHIIGMKGSTLKRLEQENNVKILVPKMYARDSTVTVTGSTERNVSETKRRISEIVISGRYKKEITHFVSIPCNNDEIKASFIRFREEILHDYHGGLDLSLFQSPEKLHLTVVVMVLLDDHERAQAAELLHHCKTDIIDPILQGNPLKLNITGIEIMNDDPSAVHVLFAKVECEPLQDIVNRIADFFRDRGFNNEKVNRENVKLHLTLINSTFRQDENEPVEGEMNEKSKFKKRQPFDARDIMSRFKDYRFGSFVAKEVHLSQRKCYTENGFYKATATIDI